MKDHAWDGEVMLKDEIQSAYPLFKQIDRQLFDDLLEWIVTQEYPPNRLLFNQSECQGFALVLEGTLRIQYLSGSGREITMYRVSKGEYCHLTILRLMFKQDIQFEVYSEGTVRLGIIPPQIFIARLADHPEFLKAVYLDMYAKMNNLYAVINNIGFESVEGRLVSYLSRRMRMEKSKILSATHEQIAVDIGATREAVTRSLGKMQEEGLVRLSRKKIEWLG